MSSTTTSPPARLLLLGIDAASPALLDAWIADGSLPHLAALAARGTVGHTRGVEGFFIGSTWPSLYTGTNPARHGVHYLLELVAGSYELRHSAHAGFVRRPPFWRALSDAGQRVAILDVPLTRLDTGLNGVQVVEWGGHDSLFGFSASDPVLAAEIVARHGKHAVGATCDAVRRTGADFRSFVERCERGAAAKGAWTRELLARGGWDLFFQVFTEGHCAGHQAWHLHDRTHPAFDATIAGEVGDPLLRAYQAIDREIGATVAAAGDAKIVVFSAHGMSHWYGVQFLLRDILIALGASAPLPPTPPSTQAMARDVAGKVWRLLPEGVRAPVRRLRSAINARRGASSRRAPRAPSIGVDPGGSRCFPHPNGLAVGGIRLNLAGREPAGVLQPGAEEEAFVAWLREELLALCDAESGRPVVREVRRTQELYEGEFLGQLPDLLVEWDDAVPGRSAALGPGGGRVRLTSPRIGVVEGENDFARTGEHRAGGWFVAAGPGIAAGRLDAGCSLLDLAPTFTAMLGVKLEGVDGRPIDALVGKSPSNAIASPRAAEESLT